MLLKTNRNRNVLVWSLVGSVAFAALVGPGSVARNRGRVGQIATDSGRARHQAPVSGVVETVLVSDGERVQRGDVLLRFDPRAAEAALEAARSKRDRLQNQVAIKP